MAEFTCFACQNTYQYQNDEDWNNFKAAEELLNLYPECKNAPTDIICEDCNKEFVKWFSSLSEEEKRKLREDQ